jgi:hypothetical protein
MSGPAGGAEVTGRPPRLASRVVAGAAAALMAAGVLGPDVRWVGALGLGELAVAVAARPGWLRRRRWSARGLCVVVGALVMTVLGIRMVGASEVGWVLVVCGLGGCAWAGALRLAEGWFELPERVSQRHSLRVWAAAAVVGAAFMAVAPGVSGWAPVAAWLGACTAGGGNR